MTEKIVPKAVYFRVTAALFALLFLTIWVASVDLGPFNLFIALAIAIVKALLVALFFMHLRHNPRITWLAASAGIIWLTIMFILTMSDFLTRS